MKIQKLLFQLFISVCGMVILSRADDQCVTCHNSIEDKPSLLFKNDIHQQNGISCADCHGGDRKSEDADQAMNKKIGYKGIPKGNDITKTCSECHNNQAKMKRFGSSIKTNQLEFFATSVHSGGSIDGGEWIAQCITCHGAHGVSSVKSMQSPVHPANVVKTCTKCHSDPSYMKKYNPSLPVDQLSKYHTSIHGSLNKKGNIDAAECASCHGSHNIYRPADTRSTVNAVNLPSTCAKCHSDVQKMKKYNIPTDQYKKFAKSVHGKALLEKHDLGAPACNDCHGNHGAIPPGVESISNVCGTCHALNADLFASSPHKKAFDQRKYPECETCHGNHEIVATTDALLGVGVGSVCSKCHKSNENQKGFVAAQFMRGLIDSLELSEKNAKGLIEEAQQKGMEVGEAKFKLRDVRQSRLESRTMVHAFNPEKFKDVVNKGLEAAQFVKSEGQSALDEYQFRRFGLGVASFIITLLAVSLFLYIRRIER
ncbi:MAG: ammonia-forming cytochrome c nitrite reductase subunit c552 [Bacteroidota bacterium]|nr:ammonia-forming cytochrome c nitrite reductase subunit c552 [Bacteroidota bacterium]